MNVAELIDEFVVIIDPGGKVFRRIESAPWIVGRERRERVSQLAWCGEGCFDSRRRVNSTVRHLSSKLNRGVSCIMIGE